MRVTRVYVPVPLSAEQDVVLQDTMAHRLQHVLRCRLGDVVHLFNGEVCQDFPATITAMDRRHVVVQTREGVAQRVCAGPKVHLYQALIKPKPMDWLVQKATELGVDAITPLYTDYTQAKRDRCRDEKNVAHWQSIVIGAAEQCGRGVLPILHHPVDFGLAVASLNDEDRHAFGAMQPPFVSMTSCDPQQGTNLFIGPEGGFSESEVRQLCARNAQASSLGPLVLRAETAALAALVLSMH